MNVWAIADLHLSFGIPNKKMDIFGPRWFNHEKRLSDNWHASINPDDLVLIPGDISWALRMEEAEPDLEWIHALPGTKVMVRGNHDYWWSSIGKVRKKLPPSIHAIQHDSFTWKSVTIGGSRLWDSSEFHCSQLFETSNNPAISSTMQDLKESDRIYQRELQRLEMSLKSLDPHAKYRVIMTHYPPLGPDLKPSMASSLIEKYNIATCVFGHLHGVPPSSTPPFGKRSQTEYRLTSCDHLECKPLHLFSV